MVLIAAPHLDTPIRVDRALRMAVVHDLGEVIAGDVPVFEGTETDARREKYERERNAMETLLSTLPSEQAEELMELWQAYEDQIDIESRVVRALDKLEAQLQHNEADLSTWLPREKDMIFQPKWLETQCEVDGFLTQLQEAVRAEAVEKMEGGGDDVEDIRARATSG